MRGKVGSMVRRRGVLYQVNCFLFFKEHHEKCKFEANDDSIIFCPVIAR